MTRSKLMASDVDDDYTGSYARSQFLLRRLKVTGYSKLSQPGAQKSNKSRILFNAPRRGDPCPVPLLFTGQTC